MKLTAVYTTPLPPAPSGEITGWCTTMVFVDKDTVKREFIKFEPGMSRSEVSTKLMELDI